MSGDAKVLKKTRTLRTSFVKRRATNGSAEDLLHSKTAAKVHSKGSPCAIRALAKPKPKKNASLSSLAFLQSDGFAQQTTKLFSKTDLYSKLLRETKNIKKKLQKQSETEEKNLAYYASSFDEAIHKDAKSGKQLAEIKSFYDSHIAKLSLELNTAKSSIKYFSETLNKDLAEKMSLIKQVHKLSKENLALSKSLESTEQSLQSLQSCSQHSPLPHTQQNWQLLLAENQVHCQTIKALQSSLKHSHQKLTLLKYALEPQDSAHISSEDEDLVEGPAKTPPKPSIVPLLALGKIAVLTPSSLTESSRISL